MLLASVELFWRSKPGSRRPPDRVKSCLFDGFLSRSETILKAISRKNRQKEGTSNSDNIEVD